MTVEELIRALMKEEPTKQVGMYVSGTRGVLIRKVIHNYYHAQRDTGKGIVPVIELIGDPGSIVIRQLVQVWKSCWT